MNGPFEHGWAKGRIRAPLTTCLIVLNVLVFLALPLAFRRQYPLHLEALGADWGPATLSGQWWRLVWSSFVHIEILHLAADMIVLYLIGRRLEQALGVGPMLLTYFGCGIAGDLAILATNPNSMSYGASAAVAGLVGALLAVYSYRAKETWRDRKWEFVLLVTLAIYTITIDLSGHSDAVHTTALLVGAILAYSVLRSGGGARQVFIIGVVFTAALTLAAFTISRRFQRGVASHGQTQPVSPSALECRRKDALPTASG